MQCTPSTDCIATRNRLLGDAHGAHHADCHYQWHQPHIANKQFLNYITGIRVATNEPLLFKNILAYLKRLVSSLLYTYSRNLGFIILITVIRQFTVIHVI